MATKEIKEKILSSLNNEELYVQKIWKADDDRISVKFIYHGRKGYFVYSLFGEDCGVEICEFDEESNEDIYGTIQDWIHENITATSTIECKGEEVKF